METTTIEVPKEMAPIFQAIVQERAAQDATYGRDGYFQPLKWQAVLCRVLGKYGSAAMADESKRVKRKLVQMAAVSVAALETQIRAIHEDEVLQQLADSYDDEEEEDEEAVEA